jgi:UDP-glucose:glycoprotein glucosyltransferase
MRKERAIVSALTTLGLEPGQAVALLTHPALAEAQGAGGVLDGLFDASDRLEGGDLIMWWNDMETDSRYARWNPSITGVS